MRKYSDWRHFNVSPYSWCNWSLFLIRWYFHSHLSQHKSGVNLGKVTWPCWSLWKCICRRSQLTENSHCTGRAKPCSGDINIMTWLLTWALPSGSVTAWPGFAQSMYEALPTYIFPGLHLYAHICIPHSGHKTYQILNWTEVPNALKEFMLHNCTVLPENKQWCMAKILSQEDDSDPSLWLRLYWAADGAICNLCSKCRTREGKHMSSAWSKGHKIRNHELFGAFGDTQCFNLF